MPYITQERRRELALDPTPRDAGELNYLIARLMDKYVGEHGLSYETIKDVRAATADASEEFYHCVAVPYETRKRLQNGEVFTASRRALDPGEHDE